MSAPETVTVNLSPAAARALHQAVASGDFTDVSAVVNAVLESWHAEHDDLFGYSPEELDRLADEAEASGPGREVDIEEILHEARREFEVLKAAE